MTTSLTEWVQLDCCQIMRLVTLGLSRNLLCCIKLVPVGGRQCPCRVAKASLALLLARVRLTICSHLAQKPMD